MPPPPLVSRLSGSACETIQLATRSLSGSTSSRYLLEISGDCRAEMTAVAIALAVALSGTAAPNGDKHSACTAFAQKGDASSATARKEVFIAGIVRRNANVRNWVGSCHSQTRGHSGSYRRLRAQARRLTTRSRTSRPAKLTLKRICRERPNARRSPVAFERLEAGILRAWNSKTLPRRGVVLFFHSVRSCWAG